MNVQRFVRGSVWWYKRHTDEKGVTYGDHPCVIVSSDEWNDKSGTVVVVPCTTDMLQGTIKTTTLQLMNSEGHFFPTQITTVPKCNLYDYIGILDPDEVATLENGIKAVLGFSLDFYSLIHLNDHSQPDDPEPQLKTEVTQVPDEVAEIVHSVLEPVSDSPVAVSSHIPPSLRSVFPTRPSKRRNTHVVINRTLR